MFSTRLIYALGCPRSLAFEDVWSLNEPDLLPKNATLARVLVLPTTEGYEARTRAEDDLREKCEAEGDLRLEDIVWFKKTVNHACGLYAILYALCNGQERDILGVSMPTRQLHSYSVISTLTKTVPRSPVKRILDEALPLAADARTQAVENSKELEHIYAEAEIQCTFVILAPSGLREVREYFEREQESDQFSLMALVCRE